MNREEIYESVGNTGQETGLAISEDTRALIVSGISENTLVAYRRATRSLETWLSGRVLSDALLAEYITELHTEETIAQVVATVKWQARRNLHRCQCIMSKQS
jgi:hypothetical protein